MEDVLANGYLMLLGVLALYGLYRYYLLILYFRGRSLRPVEPTPPRAWPRVTIQIPVYNERDVVERTIRSACEVDYPQDRLEIQVLDDSTDETSTIIATLLERYQARGLTLQHLRRSTRSGFKAGALTEGLRHAAGDFLAVFDADFLVPRDFLHRTVPFFTDPLVGMVQARWGHLNRDYSLLTRLQAILLDGHFGIEQSARCAAGHFFSFNGTAGIWRKTAIVDAGGWSAQTLTEDLDLSYRAQLKGWRGVFLPELVCPAELPIEMTAWKIQQFRWTKGSVETAKKLLRNVLRAPIPWSVKLDAVGHLTSYVCYPLGLIASLGTIPLMMGWLPWPHQIVADVVWFVLLTVSGACFYLCGQRALDPSWFTRIPLVPWSLAVTVGLSVNNAWAVCEALLGRSSPFLRTPKFGARPRWALWDSRRDRAFHGSPMGWIELGLALYFGMGAVAALHRQLWLTAPWLMLFAAGFGYVGWFSLRPDSPIRWLGGRLSTASWRPSEV
ncbi:MAG: glycosyltransferase [Candidatus Omnitrophica bacterium]|nr:glycosyltransferase [Candidatus Omnitrophota bacterium]